MKIEALETLDRLKKLSADRDALLRKLEHSLALDCAIPGVFSNGTVKVRWVSAPPHLWPQNWEITVTAGDGAVVTLKLKDHLDADWIKHLEKPADLDHKQPQP